LQRREGYRIERLSSARQMVAASATINRQKNVIHLVTEADITHARHLIANHRELTGERLSLTGYVVSCLARTFDDFPTFNSLRKGNRLIILDDLTISVLFEREIQGERVPEPVGLKAVNHKSFRQINDELRHAQERTVEALGSSAGFEWLRFMPAPLLRSFIRLASRNIGMARRFGVVGVTAIGMFAQGPLWLVPLTNATVTVAVGGIETRCVMVDGSPQEAEHLCLTISFDHDIVDGAPAARFATRLSELLSGADVLEDLV